MKKKLFSLLAVMLMTLAANAQHEYVDLGLPSGTLWATCNIGANSPEETGDLFAWGETDTKDSYTKENYSFDFYSIDPSEKLGPEDDAATVNWGCLWRMPSKAQYEELICGQYTTIEETTTLNGVKGIKVTGKNDNSIFLPNAQYWTINMSYNDYTHSWEPTGAVEMLVNAFEEIEMYTKFGIFTGVRYNGLNIRPVRGRYTISEIPKDWKVNGSMTGGTYETHEGAKVIITPRKIPAGKKIKSIKVVKQ